MKRKILTGFGIFIALIILAAVLVPVLFKGKITALLKQEINKNLEAKVDFSTVSLSLFKRFPDLSLTVNDLTIAGKNEFENDTLADVSSVSVGVNFWSVVSGSQININSVTISKPEINILVLENGKANYMIVKEDTAASTGEPAAFSMKLKSYQLTEGRLSYDDRSLKFKLTLENLNHQGQGDFSSDFFTLITSTQSLASARYEGVTYLSSAKTDIKADIDMDVKNMRFTFKQNEAKINELVFGIDGWLSMPDEKMTMDLKFAARKNEFAHFISLIPGLYSENFKDLKSSGTMEIKGFVKGTYSENTLPGFGVDLKINNGMFQYPSLPETVRNVNVDLTVLNSSGNPDHTEINLKKFHADIGPHPLDATLSVKTPVSDAQFEAMLRGKLDFGSLSRIMPLEKGTELSGILISDFDFSGRMSHIESKKYEKVNAKGNVALNSFRYKSASLADAVEISSCMLSFNPGNITLSNLNMKTGGTDLKANGTIENPAGYFFRNDLLTGNFTVSSTQADLRPYMSQPSGSSSGSSGETSAPDIPANIDFTLNFSANRVLYDNLILAGLKGNIAIREKIIGLNQVSFGLLDGIIVVNGLYNGKIVNQPSISFELDVQKMDIRKTFEHFNSVKKLAPMAGRMSGRFSSSFSIKGNLNDKLEPDYASLNGGGRLQTHGASVENFEPMLKVADALKIDAFRKATLSDANLSFRIKDGRVYVQPYEQTIAGMKIRIEGSNGIDQSIDYTWGVQVPTRNLPGAATNVIHSLIAKANSAGANLSMGETVNLNVRIGGTVTHPTVETGLKETMRSAADDLKEELERKKQELEDKARAEAERLKKEAEDKARAEAERLKKEAEEKAKAEAERLKKEAEEKVKKEAEKQLKNLFNKPK